MVQVPLADPSTTSYVGAFATGRSCHDWAVILGDVMPSACSGGDGFSMFSIGGPSGGSLDNRCFSIRGRFLGQAGLPPSHSTGRSTSRAGSPVEGPEHAARPRALRR